jgi:anti-sigma regulatory factor (Ser/Thr protein kinase)
MPKHRPEKAWPPYAQSLAAIALTTAILSFCQRLIESSQHVSYVRPYGILFVVPVALLTALAGVRVGLLTLAVSAVALEYALTFPRFTLRLAAKGDWRDWVELAFVLGVGGLVAYSMDAVRRNGALSAEAQAARERLRVSEERRRSFNREVLLAVTGGRLLLADPEELGAMVEGTPALVQPLARTEDATRFRRALRSLLAERGLDVVVRSDDALTAAMEAATNAVKHGRDGQARAWVGRDEVTVVVSDRGAGIQPQDLARATLEGGYSTAATLGMGYHLMLRTVDLMALSTSEAGTQVLLRVGGRAAAPEQQFLDRFPRADAA